MFSKKKFVLINKINVLIIVLIILIKLMPITMSRYESVATGNMDAGIAFYLLKADYYTENIKLTSLSPSDTPYVYNFSISNYTDNTSSEVDIEYDLSLVTTTNLPLRYKLYKNENYLDNGSINLINDANTRIERDENGTYFRTMTFDKETMLFSDNVKNNYTLLIYYDKNNDNPIYQDAIESVRIIVNSRQIIN